MSRSPAEAVSGAAATEYLQAFKQVYRLHEQGHSFSGRERHCAFLNPGVESGRFANISAISGLDLVDDGRAVATVDWDHDGDLDLWIANRTAPQLRLLQNDRPRDDRFLAVLLVGTTSNRDAVGARAELVLRQSGAREEVRLVKTRHAGHGFLSQSSSWLHFGLGREATIERLIVHWPGGESESFSGLESGRHYRITEHHAQAEVWQPLTPRSELAITPLAEKVTTPARALLVGRPPIPRLSYQSFAGESVDLTQQIKGPTLINLWASWCLPCAAELQDLEQHGDQLRAVGLDVVALSIDGLDPEQTTGPQDAVAFLERLELPFATGLAKPELLDKLQILHDRIFSRHIPLSVPTSFLVDTEGRWAAIYRGRIDVDRLLGDVRNLGSSPALRRAAATPFPGRWFAPPQALNLAVIARRFDAEGFLDDAVHYSRQALLGQGDRADGDRADRHLNLGELLFRQGAIKEATRHFLAALRLRPEDRQTHQVVADLLVSQGAVEEALPHYQRAIELRPEAAVTRFNYGNALQRSGRTGEAIAEYRTVIQLDGDFADAHNNLAALLLEQGDLEGATLHLEQTLRLRPKLGQAHNNLGVLLLRQGQAAQAAEHFALALELDPGDVNARANLALAREALKAEPK